MSFWKRLFSADYRAAVSAEAAGQLEQAAEHYVLAGEPTEAARIHLARAERADNRSGEIDALRDALHWVGSHEPLSRLIKKALGRALLARARDEGVATARDHRRVRDAAELLMAGGDYEAAGDALESIGETQGAVRAYRQGGLVERMEALLARDEDRLNRERTTRDLFATYEYHLRVGERDAAREALRGCIDATERKAEYQRLLDQLESRLITGGRVVLRRRNQPAITVVGLGSVVLGRDPLCEMPLRTGGVSRRHAEVLVAPAEQTARFALRDLDSRNGTLLAGMPIEGQVPLTGTGRFDLGDQCTVEFEAHSAPACLRLCIANGLDRGQVVLAAGADEPVNLELAAPLSVAITMRSGRPLLARRDPEAELTLNGEPIATGEIQLVHGDLLVIGEVEVEVE